MTKAEFAKLEQNQKINKNITFCAVVCYIAAILTLAANLMAGQLAGIIDTVIILAIGLLIHFRKSLAAAIVLLVYGAVNMAAVYIVNHNFGGWLILLAGIYAVFETAKLNKAWKAFKAAPVADAEEQSEDEIMIQQ